LGEELFRQGWRQGSLFNERSIRFVCNEIEPDGTIVPRARPTKANEQFILVSQECDLVSNDERFVEALVCKTEKSIGHVGPNSARKFVVDPARKLVAYAMYRVQIAKEILARLTPEPWPSTTERRQQFVRWLGRRFTRPAIDDRIVRAFHDPVVETLKRLAQEQPDVRAAFSRAVHDIRIKLPPHEEPPYQLELLLVLADQVSEEEADSIPVVLGLIRAELDPTLVRLGSEVVATKDDMSLRSFLDTTPIFLEHFTYEGNEQEGVDTIGPT